MSDRSAIEWTDATWNPVTGCTRVSPGCAHCYIERTPPLRIEGRRFEQVGVEETTGVRLHPERLDQPLRWRKPRRVFVCSLADLFHEQVPVEFINRVLSVIERCPQHTFQVLTKRPERMREVVGDWQWARQLDGPLNGDPVSPLENLWGGVSIENARYTWRADVLREIPAAVRFISAEPLLGSLFPAPHEGTTPRLAAPAGDVPAALGSPDDGANGHDSVGRCNDEESPAATQDERPTQGKRPLDLTGIDWVICGGESGPSHRALNLDHARELRDACLAICPVHATPAGPCVGPCNDRPAFFFKQVGGRTPKSGGRLLDGREWREMPR